MCSERVLTPQNNYTNPIILNEYVGVAGTHTNILSMHLLTHITEHFIILDRGKPLLCQAATDIQLYQQHLDA